MYIYRYIHIHILLFRAAALRCGGCRSTRALTPRSGPGRRKDNMYIYIYNVYIYIYTYIHTYI